MEENKIKLYNHQLQIIKDDKKKVGLFLGTGSGKTITALHLARGNTLVIAPKTVRDDRVWQKDLAKTGLDINLTVISKEDLRLGKYPQDINFDTVIGDESHTLSSVSPDTRQKNYKPIPKTSKVFLAFLNLIKKHNPERVYLLSATPTKSALSVFGLAYMLGVKLNFFEFRDSFYIKIKKGYREFYLPRTDKNTKERLGKIVREIGYTGKLEDFADVPTQNYKKHTVELTKEQKEKLKEVLIDYPDPLVALTKRHQVENGVLAGDEYNAPQLIADNKIDAILDYALQFPKMVVFARYTAQVEKIRLALSKASYKVLTLTGQTKNRQEVLADANQSAECIIIIQSQISAGYELPDFPVMIFASLDYSIVNKIQAEGRILRINNLKKNLYITLVADSEIDQAVYKSIENKTDFAESIYLARMNE